MSGRLFLVLALAATASGAGLPAVPKLDSRIVGGSNANITEAPYQISALFNPGQGTFSHACGGSIISKTAILTAAHCTYGTQAKQWKIRAGSTFLTGGVVIDVKKIVQHSSYNSNNFQNDISVFKLSKALTFSATISLVALPAQGAFVADGALGFITGWGTIYENGPIANNLQKVFVPTVNLTLCATAYAGLNTITTNMICAGRLATGGVDACQGDSGGPMTVNGVLVGITSWGFGCARPQFPGVYTRVPAYRTWINKNAGVSLLGSTSLTFYILAALCVIFSNRYYY